MDKLIPAAEENHVFSRLLREVREEDRRFVVSSHGKQVAQIGPCSAAEAGRKGAREAFLARLTAQPVQDIGRWRRDELYER